MRSTPQPVLTARTPGEPEPDLTALLLTHRAIRQDLVRLATSVSELAPAGSEPGRQRAIWQYTAALLAQIRAHHRSEDEIVWPVVAAVAGQAVDLVLLTDDHKAIEVAVSRVSQVLAGPAESHLALSGALGDLLAMLDEHIPDEEREVIPVMRRYLRAQTSRWCQRQECRAAAAGALRFGMPWLARYSRAGEMTSLLAATGSRARIALALGRPGYARLERHAFGPKGLPA